MMPLLAAANLRCSRAVKASASISARPQATVRASAPQGANRHGMQSCCFAAHNKAQLCRVFLYPDPAPVGRDIRVSKGGFKGTVLRI